LGSCVLFCFGICFEVIVAKPKRLFVLILTLAQCKIELLKVKVSDTTKDASSNAAGLIKKIIISIKLTASKKNL